MEPVATIAKGGQPAWTGEFEHPEHRTLRFTVKQLPRNKDWLNHAVLQEQIAPGLANAGMSTVLASALAGIVTLMERPVLSETRDEDPDDPSHVKITRVFYDPLEDEDMQFPITVWTSFWQWRMELLAKVGELKNSSGATSSAASGGSLPAPTTSPSTTRA